MVASMLGMSVIAINMGNSEETIEFGDALNEDVVDNVGSIKKIISGEDLPRNLLE